MTSHFAILVVLREARVDERQSLVRVREQHKVAIVDVVKDDSVARVVPSGGVEDATTHLIGVEMRVSVQSVKR